MSFEIHEAITFHSRSKMNGVLPQEVNHHAKVTNSTCGDHVEIGICADGYFINHIGFKTSGCTLCTASASILCEELKGLTIEQSLKISQMFESEIVSGSCERWPESLQPLRFFEYVRQNPNRRMCALLPWLALRIAFNETEAEKHLN